MSGSDVKPNPVEPQQAAKLAPPNASYWLWRPWYAKAWWAAAAIFWLAAFFAPYLFLNADHIAPLILLFHPFLVVPVLGFGFFRVWVGRHFTMTVEQGAAPDAGPLKPFPRMDHTDPTDSSYYGHPANPLSEAWRNEHVRGIH